MKSFLNPKRPIIVGMLKSKDKDGLLAEIERIKIDGADAFGFQLERLCEEMKTEEVLTEIFSAMDGYPIYATNYMRSNRSVGISWEALEEQLLMMLSLGARLIDIPGDMYHSSDMELTFDNAAIERQRVLINKIHAAGGEVLMSSHVLRFIPKETVLTIARAHIERGADITKIVTNADTDGELDENFEALHLLKKSIGENMLFLCNGKKCKKHRILGPLFASSLFLCAENARDGENQPTIKRAKEALKYYEM